MVFAYWHRSPNFGDALTPYIIEKVTGMSPAFSEGSASEPVYMVTGSILAAQPENAVVWGCGVAWANDIQIDRFRRPDDKLKIVATRGPLTRAMVQQCGHEPKAIGDPGLLLPKWCLPKTNKTTKLGIITSWVDKEKVVAEYSSAAKIIDIMSPVEEVIKQLNECEHVVAGCLHGLVAAVTYGIPTIWAKFSDRVLGDDTKFHDFLLSIGTDYQYIDLKQRATCDELIKATFRHEINLDLEPLWAACPLPKP